jgi:hypothetical protein
MEQMPDLGRLCAVSSKQDKVDIAAIRPDLARRPTF